MISSDFDLGVVNSLLTYSVEKVAKDVPDGPIAGIGSHTPRLFEVLYTILVSVVKYQNTLYKQSLLPGSDIRAYAHYSKASYSVNSTWDCSPSCLAPETFGTIVDYTWRNKDPISVGYISHNTFTKTIIVSFRGTQETNDWIQDSKFDLERWPKMIPRSKVHHGFLASYLSVADKVKFSVLKMAVRHPDYKIVFTGHSLGGGEAVLCAVDTILTDPKLKSRIHIYTYGQPRVGNKAFANGVERMKIPIYRVVHESDIVPHIPFQWLGYKHFSEEIWIHNGKAIFCGKEGESANCSSSVPYTSYNIADHSMYTSAQWIFFNSTY